jgi:hypothetical protein
MSLSVLLPNNNLRSICGDPAGLFNYVHKVLAPSENTSKLFKSMESNTTIRTMQNSYLNFINTQVKRNHDRLLKLLLTPGDD